MIISSESRTLYQEFRFINLNDKSLKFESSIINMIRNDFKDNQNLFIDVLRFLNENQKEIMAKIDKKQEYQDILDNFNLVPNAVDLVHLNQIVNDFVEDKLRNINY